MLIADMLTIKPLITYNRGLKGLKPLTFDGSLHRKQKKATGSAN